MKLSVYLSETVIDVAVGQVVNGRLQVHRVRSIPLKDGVLINDKIMEEDNLKQALRSVKEWYPQYKNSVRLVIGGRAVTKAVQIPAMGHRQMLEVARRELMGYCQGQEDMVYDYSVLRRGSKNMGNTILCGGLERCVIETYQRLFSDCGMRVKTMGIALNSVVNLAGCLESLGEGTFILAVLDGRNLMLTLYIDGLYTYTSRLRLLPDGRDEELLKEIGESVNAIVKFYGFQGDGEGLKILYVCAVNGTRGDGFWKPISTLTGLTVRPLPAEGIGRQGGDPGFCLGDHIFAVGNLIGR